MSDLAESSREVQQMVSAEVQAEEMPKLLQDRAVVRQTGQGAQLVPG